MKILVIFTGGTIGSALNGEWITLEEATNYTLIENYKENYEKEHGVKWSGEIDFATSTPYRILSENLSSVELSSLCKLVQENAKKDYDGIIVTHGTDTIQYTAAALSFSVSANTLPIVLVSANYPLEDERSNGNANFKAAVDFIKSKKAKGVFVSYKNTGEEQTQIHLGSRVICHAEAMDEVYSLGGVPFGSVDGKGVVTLNDKFNGVTLNGKDRLVDFISSPKVLMVGSFPGDDFNYNLDGVNAVLIKPYHSGTLNTENLALREFCERAKEKGVPVFLSNVAGGSAYSSAKIYKDLSLIVLPFCATPAVYVKIWMAVSLKKDVREFVINQLSAEFLE